MIEQLITSTILIITILLISTVLEKRISPCIKYSLWLLVAVKLLIPIPSFESNISVMNLVNTPIETNIPNEVNNNINTPANNTFALLNKNNSFAANKNSINKIDYFKINNLKINNSKSTNLKPNYTIPKITKKETNKYNFSKVFKIIWIIGSFLCGCYFITANLILSAKLKTRKKAVFSYHKLKVYKIRYNISPCLFGLFKPAIYINKNIDFHNKKLKYILAHEYTHYRHKDYIWSYIRCICVSIYWFNPFVWAAAFRSIRDSELACDYGTLKHIGIENRIEYGTTLIEIAEQISNNPQNLHSLVCATSITGGMREMKKRIKMIINIPRTKHITLCLLTIVSIILVGCTFGKASASNINDDVPKNDDNYLNDNLSDKKDITQTDTLSDDSKLIEMINRNKIKEQSFEVSLADWGNVTFVSCMPDAFNDNLDPLTDASFYLLSNEKILYQFPNAADNNIRESGLCEGVSFVTFEDINADNKKDIIIGVQYVSGAGPQGMIPYTEIRIYESSGNEFTYNKSLCDEINNNLPSDVTAEYIKALLLNNGIQNNDDSEASNLWKQAYIDYLKTLSDTYYNAGYDLIYVDNDDIPELVEIGGDMATGSRIVNFYNGKVNVTQLNRLFFSYIERENLLCNSEGNMDNYYDLVYKYIDGQLSLIAYGYYGAADNSKVEFDENGEPIYKYEFNDVEMSKEEYNNELNKVYDTSRAKRGYTYNEDTFTLDLYTLEEIISLLEENNIK